MKNISDTTDCNNQKIQEDWELAKRRNLPEILELVRTGTHSDLFKK